MVPDLDYRTYDLLRLIEAEEPIGSIRLVDLMQRRGHSIKGRTIRLSLADLDEAGLTEKVPGKGRRITSAGRAELNLGNVSSRREQIRERITTLTSKVTYDPIEDTGEIIASTVTVPHSALDTAFEALEQLATSPLEPILVATEQQTDGTVQLSFPSSITLDGVLATHGINATLKTAGLVEYRTRREGESADEHEDNAAGGQVVRYVDTISGEGSTMDVVSLLIEAGRTSVTAAVSDGAGLLVVDNREFPLTRFAEATDLSMMIRDRLGGVFDIRRPRESGPFPCGNPSWDFASLTYGGVGEAALALLAEHDLANQWTTLDRLIPRGDFSSLAFTRAKQSQS